MEEVIKSVKGHKWRLTRIIAAFAAGFAALQIDGGGWPGYVNGEWMPLGATTYRFGAWFVVMGLAWVKWKPDAPPTP